MVGEGLSQASCAIIGKYIGMNDIENAKIYYELFKKVTPFLIIIVMIL